MNYFNPTEQDILLRLATDSIRHGLDNGCPLAVRTETLPPSLQTPLASFVTLTIEDQLRGCIGTLEAARPLACDVAYNAYAAAYTDPRFPPVTRTDIHLLNISISILSAPEPLAFSNEQDLLAQLRPGIDGLILQEGGRRGTFLPSVWKNLSQPEEFLRQLKRKAGLPAHYWSNTLEIQRYTATYIQRR